MKKSLYLALFLLPVFFLFSNTITLKDKLLQSKEGQYIVTNQKKIYSLLFIRKKTDSRLLLEEISLPEAFYKKHPIHSWKEWVNNKAPGHSLWMIYEIDLKTAKIQTVYSPSEKTHYKVSEKDSFFANLLSLPLEKIPLEQRRKIGPPPHEGESDTRPLWNPILFVDGKNSPSTFTAYLTTFPKDDSEFSGKQISLYFADTELCLPIWMQVETGHYTVMLHAIDSGKDLKSPASFLPFPLPSFEKPIQRKEQEITLSLFPLNEEDFTSTFVLYAVDVTKPQEKTFHCVPFSSSRKDGRITLHIAKENIDSLLVKNHRYLWVFHPQDFPDLFIEHTELFIW